MMELNDRHAGARLDYARVAATVRSGAVVERYVLTSRLKEFHTLSSLVGNLIPDVGDRPIGGATQAELERRWPACAGRAGAMSFPLLFRSGRLVIFTDSAIWATELRHLQGGIKRALEDLGVTSIEVKATPKAKMPERGYRRNVTLSPRNGRDITAAASGLSDPDLKAAINRLAEHGKDTKKDRP